MSKTQDMLNIRKNDDDDVNQCRLTVDDYEKRVRDINFLIYNSHSLISIQS
jgi:hypothetical protein